MSSVKTSYAFKMMAALAISGSIFAAFAAHADDSLTNAIELNPSFRVHSAPEANSPSSGTISKSEIISAEQMKAPSASGATWVKVQKADGSTGYVRGGTIHKVVLGDNYIVHEGPSLSGKRVGTVAQVSKDAPLVLTGRSKITTENNKKINWLEVLHNGKAAWVASDSVKSVDAEKTAKTPIVKSEKPAPKKWTAPKHPPLPVDIGSQVTIAEPATKPTAGAKPKVTAKSDKPKIVAVQIPDSITPPPKKGDKGPAAKKLATKPAAATDLVCVKTREEFKASPVMKKAFGAKYDPFVQWTGDAGKDAGKVEFIPANDSEGTWLLQSLDSPKGPDTSASPATNVAARVPAQICVDQAGKHKFVSAMGTEIELTDKNQITIPYQESMVTFKRTVK